MSAALQKLCTRWSTACRLSNAESRPAVSTATATARCPSCGWDASRLPRHRSQGWPPATLGEPHEARCLREHRASAASALGA
eukprot:scaffold1298_cov382-Prasinococcus_capsulatus_cf.AAC.3